MAPTSWWPRGGSTSTGSCARTTTRQGCSTPQQPDLPGAALPAADGNYAVYLDVWERHITGIDQHDLAFPPLLESALQGPDTATRTRTVWQVKLSQIQTLSCADFVLPGPPTGHLRAREIKVTGPLSDCSVPAGGGYRRLENQLYRVEVHDASQAEPLMKWSRDNGSIASKVKSIDTAALTIAVADEGRDDVLGFGAATWVELTDDERVLRGEAGSLFEVSTVTGTSVVVKNPGNLSLTVGTNATLRRWDGVMTLGAATPAELEDGVQVEIDDGTFGVGDYWMIPARTSTGLVEWPRDSAEPPAPVFETRHGTAHHYGVLAVVSLAGGAFSALADCRNMFPPLTAITASDVSYDPANCANLAGTTTVQEAIDVLCKTAPTEEEKGIHVEKILLSDGSELLNDSLVRPEQLASGIRIICSDELFQDSVRNSNGTENPVCLVTLDLPWPTSPSDRDTWGTSNLGLRRLLHDHAGGAGQRGQQVDLLAADGQTAVGRQGLDRRHRDEDGRGHLQTVAVPADPEGKLHLGAEGTRAIPRRRDIRGAWRRPRQRAPPVRQWPARWRPRIVVLAGPGVTQGTVTRASTPCGGSPHLRNLGDQLAVEESSAISRSLTGVMRLR